MNRARTVVVRRVELMTMKGLAEGKQAGKRVMSMLAEGAHAAQRAGAVAVGAAVGAAGGAIGGAAVGADAGYNAKLPFDLAADD